MRKLPLFALTAILVGAGAAACDDTDETGPTEERLTAALSGNNEVPVRATTATGTAEFTIGANNVVSYTLNVSNLRNVTAAHIHGPATDTTNAGVVVTLFTSTPALAGPTTGQLRAGTFTVADNNAQGQPVASIDSVLAWMRTGRAYVNVHTNDGVAPTNTGAGDFPGGEIRGTIRRQ